MGYDDPLLNKRKPTNTEVCGLFPTPRVGLEPTTTRLTAECSTIELSRIIQVSFYDFDLQLSLRSRPSVFLTPSKLHIRIIVVFPSIQPSSPDYWSSFRPISTGQLHTLLRFHLRPIYLAVFKGSIWISHLEGGFTLRCLQRLSLPNSATRLCH